MGTTADKLNKVLQTKEAIRTAINNKGGTLTETDTFASYATAIENIQSGSANEPITITQNGTYTAPDGVGYSPINVNVPSKEEETKSITITENGTTTVLPTSGKVLSKVDIVANVQSGGGNPLQSLLDKAKSARGLFYGITDSNVLYTPYHYMNDSELADFISSVNTSSCTDMSSMFYYCSSLTTIPQLDTSSCINMKNMFYSCSSLTTIPQLDTSKCTNMSHMFNSCKNLITIPQLDTSKVTAMDVMFSYCSSLTSIPQLDTGKVTNMSSMFYNCTSLTTIPQLDTSSCTDFDHMFSDCSNLTSIPQLNTSKATNMGYMYDHCSNLTTIPQVDASACTSVRNMFQYCSKLKSIDITHMNITQTLYSQGFAKDCYSLTKLIIHNMDIIPVIHSDTFSNCYHFYGTTNATYNPEGLKDGRIYVPDDKVEALKTATNWSVFADNIFPLSSFGKAYISNINSKSNSYTINKSSLFSILLLDFINTPEVIITSSNEQIATISDIVITTEKITFKANYLSIGVATITVQITGDASATKTIDVNVIESMQCRVEQISEVTYGFTLNSNEYYESTNKGKSSSYSLCKLVFIATEKNNTLKLECINNGESNYDFGILSNIDTTLSLSSNTDSTNVYKSFKGQSSTAPFVITYPEATVGEHFIYIKYKKDSSGDQGNDSLQFKVIS